MKHILYILLLAIVFTACGEKQATKTFNITTATDVAAIKKQRDILVAQKQDINAQLQAFDAKIDALTPEKKLPLITTFTAKAEKFEHFLELQGNVATKKNLVLTPEMGGILKQVLVREGQNVSSGQALAIIDDGGMSQQVTQLEISANLAKTTFERQQRLWEQKIGSEIQYLQAKSAYESQVEAVNQLKTQLGKTTVRAPFSGVIDDVITEQGSVVAPGQSPLMRLVNLNNMYISVDVPERYIADVTKHKKVNIEFPVLGETLSSKIRQTGNFINPANRTFNIEIPVPNRKGNIKPNLTAKLNINDYTNNNALLIPQDIISENAEGEQYIYVLQEKNGDKAIAKKVIIETGKTQGNVIEVLKGIEDKADIIQKGARSVKDGQKVQIITN